MHYSEPRYTKDLDVWVEPTIRNSRALFRALEAFGAPLANIEPETFKEPGVLYIYLVTRIMRHFLYREVEIAHMIWHAQDATLF